MPRRIHQNRSLSEVHESVDFPIKSPNWRRWLAVSGPALLVAIGYMDPGNWATDIAGGSRYNYTLIWVLLMSNLMAILLQSMAARLGIVSRRDLAQVSHEEYPPIVNYALYGLAEIAITACDLAEVIGSAIALQLLFGIPLLIGVILTALDTFLLLLLSQFGIRKLEAVVLALVSTIGVAFFIEILLGRPDWAGIVQGFVPSIPDSTALYISIGILGATVMPHNLYLHSSLVQTRKIAKNHTTIQDAIRWNNIDIGIAMNLAFFINAAILVMAASVFFRNGLFNVSAIQDAYRLLEPILGAAIAPIAFAIALLASGQASTITGTLAGQVVMEGYLNLRIRPWLRRLITRLLAVIPAVLVISRLGEGSTGDMLVLSQVVLSLQLPFAVIPLIHAVTDKERMGKFAIKPWMQILGWLVAAIILVLNVKLVFDQVGTWTSAAGDHAWLLEATVLPLAGLLGLLVIYVIVHPWLSERLGGRITHRVVDVHKGGTPAMAKISAPKPYRRIAVALDFSGKEEQLLNEALRLAEKGKTELHLLHVVESPVARALGTEGSDQETHSDLARLELVAAALRAKGFKVTAELGAGVPAIELSRLINERNDELVILGEHGHSGVSDLAYGSTIDSLRHRVKAKLLVVPL
jgi:manganese transport protein